MKAMNPEVQQSVGASSERSGKNFRRTSLGKKLLTSVSSTISIVNLMRNLGQSRTDKRNALDTDDVMSRAIPPAAKDLLLDIEHWKFDMFSLYDKSDKHPLVATMCVLVTRIDVIPLRLEHACATLARSRQHAGTWASTGRTSPSPSRGVRLTQVRGA